MIGIDSWQLCIYIEDNSFEMTHYILNFNKLHFKRDKEL